MGGDKIGQWLKRYALEVPEDRAIVEVGAWLGAGTQHLNVGRKLYVYDRFRALPGEVIKARAFGVDLVANQDTLPWVEARVPGPLYIQGEILDAHYDGPRIGLYVDDACKREPLWNHAIRTFSPQFVPGETVVFLMDFDYPVCDVQRRYVEAEGWKMLERRIGGTSCAVFRC